MTLTIMLTLDMLLSPFGFDGAKRVKLARHQDSRWDIERLYRAGQFDFYQSIQRRPVFHSCDVVVSFLGRPGTHALFVGVYSVSGVEGPDNYSLPDGFLYAEMRVTNSYRYSLQYDARFEELRGRLVIDWGLGTRSWVQSFKVGGKAVVELLPKGYVRDFPGFLDVVLRYDELVDIVTHPVPHRDWHRMLKSVAGVYLILDTSNGAQYVGSAYGEEGLLGRWTSYAKSGHGGNEQLRELLKTRPNAARDFQFSILQTLPITLTAREVIAYEILHKQKLGSRAHGLNSN